MKGEKYAVETANPADVGDWQWCDMISILPGIVLPWALLAVGGWFLYRQMRQQAGIRARLDAVEQTLSSASAFQQRRRMRERLHQFALEQQSALPAPDVGLTLGTPAPDFALPDLLGQQHRLKDYRGRKVLLIFFNPDCGYCVQMLPDLAGLPVDDGRVVPIVIDVGRADANRDLVSQQNVRCTFLLDAKGETMPRYQAQGTPTGYLIDEKGAIASRLAVGADALLALAEAAPADEDHSKPKGKANRGLAASRLIRDGLKAGTPAPSFRLPRLDGGELALEELRGRPLLLVFSDPECGPCNAVAAQLESLHRRMPEVQILMIGRRDAEINRKKVADYGLTFPVVLQKQWEISKLYGIFATPIAYLIDENGIIVRDVAKGADAILGLLAPSPRAMAA